MSGVSKYFKLTEQLLLEYIPADQDAINMRIQNPDDDYTPTKYYIYEGNDTNIYYTQNINTNIHGADYYSQQATMMKFPDETDSEYTYPGTNSTLINSLQQNTYSYVQKTYSFSRYYYDAIRIHFIYGFTLDQLSGFSIQVKGPASYQRYDYKINPKTGQYVKDQYGDYIIDKSVPKITDTTMITLLDFFFPKEKMKDAIHWDKNPLYLNSKFYDRYIEVKFPSYYQIACDNNIDFTIHTSTDEEGETTSYTLNVSEPITVFFATVSESNVKKIINETSYAKTFLLDAIVPVGIKPASNSDFFNIRIYENPYEKNIIYYPTYGAGSNIQDLSLEVMNEIESGGIPMIDQSYKDNNYNEDEFYEMYGEDARKWIIYNELNITYVYSYYLHDTNTSTLSNSNYHQYFTNMIDYTGKTMEDGDFWRTTFIPSIKQKNNMYCKNIIIQYTCRLVNRVNGAEAIRTASLTVDPKNYQMQTINLSGITQYKVINRVSRTHVQKPNVETKVIEKYIRSYYDATDLIVKDVESGLAYTQGQMTLRLKHSSTNYCLRLFTLNSDNVRIPYDLTGPYDYKLVFPQSDGYRMEIKPNSDSIKQNLGIGSLVFYITADQVKKIMNIPSDDRYFAIIIDFKDSHAPESTLYEGKVEYYT